MIETTDEPRTAERPRPQAQRVQTHFDQVGSEWGDRYRGEPRRMSNLDLVLRRDNVHRLLGPLMAAARSRLRVLDIGCGSGDVLDGLGRDVLDVVGFDLVPVMVASAARRHPEDRFVVADATRLPVAEGTADVITCLGVLEYIPAYESVLASLLRILRPGGHLIASFPNRRSLFRKLSDWEMRVEAVAVALRDRSRGRRRSGESRPIYDHRQWTLGEVRSRFTAAGFAVPDVRFNTFGLWGILGRWRPMLGMSRWLTVLWHQNRLAGSWMASTMVVLARRPIR